MTLLLQFLIFNEPSEDFLIGLEQFCIAFNGFAVIFFGYMKFLLAFILIAIGLMTFLRLRGIYIQPRLRNIDKTVVEHDQLDNPRIILATIYIIIGFGIIFDWFTLFLIAVLDPLPDRLIFSFINFHGYIDPYYLNRISDLNATVYPHEQTIYYCIAYGSFVAIVDLMIAVWYLVNKIPFNPKRAFGLLTGGVITGIFMGFTTCLPLFL
ncbi:MAG: hypothetical protein ACFFA6_12380 [Promethearchaeota archaeon]